MEANHFHPLPWHVEYRQRFPEWHPKSRPVVVDAKGDIVCDLPQGVEHPGLYDIVADCAAMTIVECVNAASGTERCPECGYTRDDCRRHQDQHLCPNHPFFPEEQESRHD